MRIHLLHTLSFLVVTFLSVNQALAEGPPSPYDQNVSGPYVAGTMSFGQSRAVSESNPGVGWFMGAEGGYIAAREAWNRLEVGVEAGMGKGSFKKKSIDQQVDLDIDLYVLAKFGYAYSIGHHTYGVLRIGAGPVSATYPAKAIPTSSSSESISGFMGMFGFDVVIPAGEDLEFVAGVENRIANFTGDEVDSFQVNVPGLRLAARLRL